MTNIKSLNGEWRLRAIGETPGGVNIPGNSLRGNVPGTVHTDLMSNGLIPDPFFRDNELKVQWIEDLDWEYSKEFDLDDAEVSCPIIYLTFEGIDTVAEIFLNNVRVLRVQNMFVVHKVRIEKFVRKGKNLLRVHIRSPKKFAIKQEQKHGKIFAELDTYRVHIRKAQYSFGWDWGPRLAANGIWRDVHIDFVSDVLVEESRLATLKIGNGRAEAMFIGRFISVPRYGMKDKIIRLTISDDKISKQFVFPFALSVNKKMSLEEIEPWWTHDVGTPKLYNVIVDVNDKRENIISSREFKTGFRIVELVRKPDNFGESFIFKLNGEEIFARGANWIPSDSFLPRVRTADYQVLIRAAREANMNMLRVWGGGIYEDEEFYKACDENGILIWQDFMFACASYPEYKEFMNEVKQEAVQNVRRISSHPCIAIFCGNNESEWLWQRTTGNPVDEMPGAFIFKKMLHDIVRSESRGVAYWRSSPFGGEHPNDENAGDHHQWDVWSAFRSPAEYKKNQARFVSEFGFQSPPSLTAIDDFTDAEDREMQSQIMRFHNKQVEGTERLFRFTSGEVKLASDFENIVLQMQLVQAKAIKTGVDHWRKRKWKTAGTLFWQLNDCWPVSSWSAVDYNKRPKALYYWAKKFFKPIKLIMDHEGDCTFIHLVNDTLNAVKAKLEVDIMDVHGDILNSFSEEVTARKNSASLIQKISISEFENDKVFICARLVESTTGRIADEEEHLLVPWLDFQFEKPRTEINVSEDGNGKMIHLKSDRFIVGVYLSLNETVGELSDNFLTLIPGREKTVAYAGKADLQKIELHFPVVPP